MSTTVRPRAAHLGDAALAARAAAVVAEGWRRRRRRQLGEHPAIARQPIAMGAAEQVVRPDQQPDEVGSRRRRAGGRRKPRQAGICCCEHVARPSTVSGQIDDLVPSRPPHRSFTRLTQPASKLLAPMPSDIESPNTIQRVPAGRSRQVGRPPLSAYGHAGAALATPGMLSPALTTSGADRAPGDVGRIVECHLSIAARPVIVRAASDPGAASARARVGPHDPGAYCASRGGSVEHRLDDFPGRGQPVRSGEQRPVAEQDVVDQTDVRRQRIGARQVHERDSARARFDVEARARALDDEAEIDLAAAGEGERQARWRGRASAQRASVGAGSG